MNFKHCICVDGGASKTVVRVLDEYGATLGDAAGSGISLIYENPESIWPFIQHLTIQAAVNSLRPNVPWFNTLMILGIAGAELAAAVEKLRQVVPPEMIVHVMSDGYIGLVGALGPEHVGTVFSIGTGVVGFSRESSGNVRRVAGWGFPLADEGGGAWIGRAAARAAIRPFERPAGQIITEFHRDVYTAMRVKASPIDVAMWARTATAANYAQLAAIVISHADINSEADQILASAARQIDNLVRNVLDDTQSPVCFIGSLAAILLPRLSEDILSRTKPPRGTAIDGAVQIARDTLMGLQRHLEYAA